MPRQDLTFRVFVSSTFSDMLAERNALQDDVFPRLRAHCEARGARFQAVDLRWGVSLEASRDQQTMRICLQELARCRFLSPRPNFLILLGNRYGWRPLPEEIDAAAYAALRARAAPEDRSILDVWYRRDHNAVPPVCWLQPRPDDPAATRQWMDETEPRLRRILTGAVAAEYPDPDDPRRRRFECSATHQEILAGALEVPDAAEHVVCCLREIDGLPADAAAGRYRDLSAGRPDLDSEERLGRLKAELRERLPPERTYEYRALWDGGAPALDVAAFSERVDRDLCAIIDRELETLGQASELDGEIALHRGFAAQRAALVVGRETLLGRIGDAMAGESRVPILIHGPPGSGKSALVARAVDAAAARFPSAVRIARFCGISPGASSLQTLLESVLAEVARAYGDERPIPADIDQLCRVVSERLEVATADRPLFLFLDALDQLSRPATLPPLQWLPHELPPHVQLVISTIDANDETGEWLAAARRLLPDSARHEVGPLTQTDGAEILDAWHRAIGRTLQPAQREHVLERFRECPYPLFLRLAFEESRRWRSDEGLPPRGDGRLGLSGDTDGLVGDLVDRLSEPDQHGPVLTGRALAALAASRHGLAEDELLDILSADRRVMADFRRRSPDSPPVDHLPVVVWSRLYAELAPYLATQRVDGVVAMNFYHRQILRAVERRLLVGRRGRVVHWHLARYFLGQTRFAPQPMRFAEDGGGARPNRRKLSELPWQLAQAGRRVELTRTLINRSFLEAKAEAGMALDLCDDYARAQADLPDGPLKRTWRLIEEALRRDALFLNAHPETLLQCLWNSVWWHDGPELAVHYDPPPDDVTAGAARGKLALLLQQWRAERERDPRPWTWLRSLRPPAVRLGTGQRAILRGHAGPVHALAFSPDGRRLASAGQDGTVRLWDLESGVERLALRAPLGPPKTVAFSESGAHLAAGFSNGTVHVWLAEEGRKIVEFRGSAQTTAQVALQDRDGLRIAFGGETGGLAVREHAHGRELLRIGQVAGVKALAFSPTATLLAVGDREGTVHVVSRDAAPRRLERLSGLRQLAFSIEGTRLSALCDDTTVFLWDAATWQQLPGGMGDRGSLFAVAVSRDGEWVAAGMPGGQVRVWQSRIGVETARFHGHEADVASLAFSDDGRWLASGDRHGSIRIRDLTGDQSAVLIGHEGTITSVAAAAEADRVATGSLDGTVRVWNSLDGTPVAVLRKPPSVGDAGRLAVFRCWSVEGLPQPSHQAQATSNVPIQAVALTRDGRGAAGAALDRIHLWESATGRAIGTFVADAPPVSLAFDTQGRLLAGYSSGLITGWAPQRGIKLFDLPGHNGAVYDLSISADGRLTSLSEDGTRRTWDLTLLKMARVDRIETLTDAEARAPWRIKSTAEGHLVRNAASGPPLAWLAPLGAQILRAGPQPWVETASRRTWAGGFGNYLALITLECSLPAPIRTATTAPTPPVDRPCDIPRFELAEGLSLEPRWDAGLTVWVPPDGAQRGRWRRLVMEWPPRVESLDGWQRAAARVLELRPAGLRDRFSSRTPRYETPDGARLIPVAGWQPAWFLWPAATTAPERSPAPLQAGDTILRLGPQLLAIFSR